MVTKRRRLLFAVSLVLALALIGIVAVVLLANPLLQTWSVRAPVEAVAFGPNGHELAIGLLDGTIQLRQGGDGALIRAWPSGPTMLQAMALSPDGQILATAGPGTQVHLWQVNNGHLLTRLDGGRGGAVNSLAFSPDGHLLAAGDEMTIYVWQVPDGRLGQTLDRGSTQLGAIVGGSEGTRVIGTTALAFNPAGQILAASSNRAIRLWRVDNGQLLRTLNLAGAPTNRKWDAAAIQAVAFSPDGTTLATGSGSSFISGGSSGDSGEDHVVRLWNVASGQLGQTLADPEYAVGSVVFSPDGQMVAAAGGRHDPDALDSSNGLPLLEPQPHLDAVIRLWRVRDGQLVRTLDGHTNFVASVAFSPDGQTLASGSEDGTVRLWRVK